MRSTKIAIAVLLGLATLVPLAAQSDTGAGIRRLIPGLLYRDKIVVNQESGGDSRVEFRLSIPKDAYAVNFQILDAPADLDLYLYRASTVYAYSEQDYFTEELRLSMRSDPELQPGEYRLAVRYQLPSTPFFGGQEQLEIPFTLSMNLVRVESSAELRANGLPISSSVAPENAMIRAFSLPVPQGATKLRVDISALQGDLDLYAVPGGLNPNFYDTSYSSYSYGSAEWLVLDPVADATAEYGIVVVGIWDSVPADFSISVVAGEEPPHYLKQIPLIPQVPAGLQQSILATIEVLDAFGGGSGCIITADGYILTNYHVVENSYLSKAQVRINLSLDDALPPREVFLADIVAVEPAHDLALLKISSGLYGQPLPEWLELPFHPIGNPQDLRMGETLNFIGYPAIGSIGSRTSVTLTRGIVSGFEKRGPARVIKTDAQINYGNSGGAAVDSQGRLVGLPTERVFDDGGQIGYIYSVEQVPAQWWEMAGVDPPF